MAALSTCSSPPPTGRGFIGHGNLLHKPQELLTCFKNSSTAIGQLTTCSNGAQMFCPYGCFVPTDVLSRRTVALLDVLSRRAFCPSGHFVPPSVLAHGCYFSSCYVARRFVSGRFIPPDVLSPDVLSGHRRNSSPSTVRTPAVQ